MSNQAQETKAMMRVIGLICFTFIVVVVIVGQVNIRTAEIQAEVQAQQIDRETHIRKFWEKEVVETE